MISKVRTFYFFRIKVEQKSMKESMKQLSDRLSGHDDSLFSVNTNFSNLKLSLDDTSITMESTRREQYSQLDRIEKLENDLILIKDESETSLKNVRGDLGKMRETALMRKDYEEDKRDLKREIGKDIKNNEEEIKRLALRVIELEKQMPIINGELDHHSKKIDEILDKLSRLDN